MTRILAVLLLVLTPLAYGQATPTASRSPIFLLFQHRDVPNLEGNFEYSLSASETYINHYNGGTGSASFSNLTGDLAFLSRSNSHPLSVIYSGGYLASSTGQPSSVFQNLDISQVLVTRNWSYVVANNFSYLPQTPTTGLSGIPGVGDLGGVPTPGVGNGQDILTGVASRVNDTAQASITHQFTGNTSMIGSGSYLMQRFVGNSSANNIDNNQITFFAGPNHRIDARNSINGNITYSRFSYTGNDTSFNTEGINVGYTRQWTRRLSMSASAGPQRTTSSSNPAAASATGVTPAVSPGSGLALGESAFGNTSFAGSSISLAANVDLAYTGRGTRGDLSYSRGVNNGSGVIEGALSDSVRLDLRHNLGRQWDLSGQLGFARSSSLSTIAILPFSTETYIASVQASRSVTRTLYAFVSYTAEKQNLNGTIPNANIFNGVSQILGAGLTYSPGPLHRRGH